MKSAETLVYRKPCVLCAYAGWSTTLNSSIHLVLCAPLAVACLLWVARQSHVRVGAATLHQSCSFPITCFELHPAPCGRLRRCCSDSTTTSTPCTMQHRRAPMPPPLALTWSWRPAAHAPRPPTRRPQPAPAPAPPRPPPSAAAAAAPAARSRRRLGCLSRRCSSQRPPGPALCRGYRQHHMSFDAPHGFKTHCSQKDA